MKPTEVDSCNDVLLRNEPALQNSTDILQLPPEMLVTIFNGLCARDKGRVAQVCKAWRDTAYNPMVWRHLEVVVNPVDKDYENVIPNLVKRGVCKMKVTALNGQHCLRDLMDEMPNLYRLNLTGCKGLDADTLFSAFLKERFTLYHLIIGSCANLTDTNVALIAMKFKNLRFLSILYCSQLTDTALRLIANGLLNLKMLALNSNDLITDKGIGYLSGIDGHKADCYCQLDYLYLCSFNQLTDQSLKHLSEGQANLQTLSLQNCAKVTFLGIKYISEMDKLIHLCLSSENFGDEELLQLSMGKSLIKAFSILNSSISDIGLITIGKWAHLRYLLFNNCSDLTDVGLYNMLEQGSRITTLIIMNCSGITDEGLVHVAKLPCLRKLNLKSDKISNEGLVNLVDGESKITNLVLSGCNTIGPQALHRISSGLFSMQSLTLDKGHVNQAGMALAARSLSKLTSLVSGRTQLIREIFKIRMTLCFRS